MSMSPEKRNIPLDATISLPLRSTEHAPSISTILMVRVPGSTSWCVATRISIIANMTTALMIPIVIIFFFSMIPPGIES